MLTTSQVARDRRAPPARRLLLVGGENIDNIGNHPGERMPLSGENIAFPGGPAGGRLKVIESWIQGEDVDEHILIDLSQNVDDIVAVDARRPCRGS
jgi:hypothetical protein